MWQNLRADVLLYSLYRSYSSFLRGLCTYYLVQTENWRFQNDETRMRNVFTSHSKNISKQKNGELRSTEGYYLIEHIYHKKVRKAELG